jgi:hypothetical protein
LLTATLYVFASFALALAIEKVEEVAPEISVPPDVQT